MTPEEKSRFQTDHLAVLEKIDALLDERKTTNRNYREELKVLKESEAALRRQLQSGEIEAVQLPLPGGES
jgi:hypothetical protein